MNDLPDGNPKTAVGRLKPQVHAVPPSAEIACGMAMQEGEIGYGLFNWREDPVSATVYYDAIRRHLASWRDGEDNSPVEVGIAKDGTTFRKGGIPHLAHVMACCAILIDADICGTMIDDRGPKGPVAEMITTIWNARTAALASEVVEATGPIPVAPAANVDDPVDMAALESALKPFAPALDLNNA